MRKITPLFAVALLAVSGSAWAQPNGSSSTAPSSSSSKVEALKAAPADASSAAEADVTPAVEKKAQKEGTDLNALTANAARSEAQAIKHPFGITLVLDHSVGTSTFTKSRYVGGDGYVVEHWRFVPRYTTHWLHHTITVSADVSLGIEFTKPNSNPARRWTPSDTSLGVSDSQLYLEPFTGINVSGSLRWSFPTSYESINVTKRWGALSASFGLSRSFGPVDLAYGFSFTKDFNSSYVHVAFSTLSRNGDTLYSARSQGSAAQIESGTDNTSFSIQNSVQIAYNITSKLAVGYALGFFNTFHYDTHPTRDQYTAPQASVGMQKGLDMISPTLEVDYQLSDALAAAKITKLPFRLMVAAGISSLHPIQTANNKGIIWPFFYQSFGENRAADNYGSIYVDLVGIY